MNNQKLCTKCQYCEKAELLTGDMAAALFGTMIEYNVCTNPKFITPQFLASGDKARLRNCSYIRSKFWKCGHSGRFFTPVQSKCETCKHNHSGTCSKNNNGLSTEVSVGLFCENNIFWEGK